MKNSEPSFLPKFSHLYLEDGAEHYPLAQSVLARFPSASIIRINDYKEVFNRNRQDWRAQKRATKLIIAVKRDPFLYPTTDFIPDVGFKNTFYTTPILNCLYDCHYCYLQGMYPSAHMVIFVNTEDFFASSIDQVRNTTPLHLSLSYDTDLLAFENVVPLTRQWIEFSHTTPEIFLEIRTKSSNFKSIEQLPATPQVTLAWTLSPHHIAQAFETSTPSLRARILSIVSAIKKGWKVRVCLDPVLLIDEWRKRYHELLTELFSHPESKHILDFSIGTFRMNAGHFKRIEKQRPHSPLIQSTYSRYKDQVGYPQHSVSEVREFFTESIIPYLPIDRLRFALPPTS